jgi:hypothetical protein
MNIFSIGTGWLILLVFLLTFISILLIRSEDRFWLPCIVIWLFLFFAWILNDSFLSTEINYYKAIESNGTIVEREDPDALTEVEKLSAVKTSKNRKLLHILGFHSIMSLIWVWLGYRTTGREFYKKAMVTFTVISIIYIVTLII